MIKAKTISFQKPPVISMVVPVYGCGACLFELQKRLTLVLKKIVKSYEIIYVDDRSLDNGWEVIKEIASKDKNVKGVRLSRNFGQHHAITAGVDEARGEYLVVMDCDLQDNPEAIEKLYHKAKEGYDVVFVRRVGRVDGPLKKMVSVIFNSIFSRLTGIDSDPAVGNFSIISKPVISVLKNIREQNRSYRQTVKWLGFRSTHIDAAHQARFSGKTTYSFGKMLDYGLDSLTAHSDKPLRTAIYIGFAMSLISFIFGTHILVRRLVWGIPIVGWPSLFVSILFLFGLTLGFLGILGLYIGKIFDEAKDRPLYVIEEKTVTK